MLVVPEVIPHHDDTRPQNQEIRFSLAEAKRIGDALGVRWDQLSVEQFRLGMNIEGRKCGRDSRHGCRRHLRSRRRTLRLRSREEMRPDAE
jgi:hypothetical protein